MKVRYGDKQPITLRYRTYPKVKTIPTIWYRCLFIIAVLFLFWITWGLTL